jgi:hypothetical protein
MSIQFQSHAESIYDAAQSYKNRVKKYGKANCKASLVRISEMIRGLDGIRGANYASKAIMNSSKIEISLGLKWNKRKEIGGMFEHSHPIFEIRSYLLDNNLTLEQALDFLWNEYAVSWITYEEDAELRRLGYSKSRTIGWKKCYEEAGIEIVEL